MAPSSFVTNIVRRHQKEENCCRHPKRNRPKLLKLSLKMPRKSAAPKSVAAPAPKAAKTAKSAALPSPMHPPYLQMIKEAIASLKDRTGSSQPAIAKFIEEKYRGALPPNFKKLLSVQLKRFANSEKLVKVKNSFKITPAVKKPAASAEEKPKKAAARKDSSKPAKSGAAAGAEKGAKMTPAKSGAGEAKAGTTKMKRLSQVKTPPGMKRKKPSTPKKVPKSVKAVATKKTTTKRAKTA